jgi:serine protease inhibitor
VKIKIILSLLLICLIVGCLKDYEIKSTLNKINIINYDNCEYIYISDAHQGFLSHKGDCANRIHYDN